MDKSFVQQESLGEAGALETNGTLFYLNALLIVSLAASRLVPFRSMPFPAVSFRSVSFHPVFFGTLRFFSLTLAW